MSIFVQFQDRSALLGQLGKVNKIFSKIRVQHFFPPINFLSLIYLKPWLILATGCRLVCRAAHRAFAVAYRVRHPLCFAFFREEAGPRFQVALIVRLLFNFQKFNFAVNVAGGTSFGLLSQRIERKVFLNYLAPRVKTLLFEGQNLPDILHDCLLDTFLAVPSGAFNFLPKSDCAESFVAYKPKLFTPLL